MTGNSQDSSEPADHRDDRPLRHDGPAHSAPYPVSRLAPRFDLVDLAREIETADQMINARLGGQMAVIAEQVKALQAQARAILAQARSDQQLNRARCAFRRIPGRVYHLYQAEDGGLVFSMLSPDDWRGQPPQRFIGSYRLQTDMSWTAADTPAEAESGVDQLARLLGAATGDRGDTG